VLLGDGPVNTSRPNTRTQQWKNGASYVVRAVTVAMQRRAKHSSTTEAVFSMWSVPGDYLEDNWGNPGSCQLRGYSQEEGVQGSSIVEVLKTLLYVL
jgi:hypothetical protein